MMKLLVIASVVATVGLAGNAFAGCSSPQLSNADLVALNGKIVCVGTGGNWEAQEYHSGGSVFEYARGPGHATDPRHQVGTYLVSGASITYNYSGGPSYTYTVHNNGANYSFCTGSAEKAVGTIRTGDGPCP